MVKANKAYCGFGCINLSLFTSGLFYCVESGVSEGLYQVTTAMWGERTFVKFCIGMVKTFRVMLSSLRCTTVFELRSEILGGAFPSR